MTATDPAALRRDYADRMLRIAGVTDSAVAAAFATVPREAFLGPDPWTILDQELGAVTLAENDPARIYEDVLVVLDRQRGLNNGSPSLHARMLHHLAVRPGDRVLHLGAGSGYYTALLAELTGPQGTVTAIEYDRHLAATATANLAPWRNVTVRQGDAALWPRDTTDRIYVNFAVADPAAAWTGHLAPGGMLVFPLAPAQAGGKGGDPSARGAVLAIGHDGAGFPVRHLCPCAFVTAAGRLAGTPALRESLARAFARPGVEFVRSYLRPAPRSPERCWFWCPDWALGYDAPPEQLPSHHTPE
ncbi:L-isoaspartyl protein carboxyl methyltransferase [Rhodovastum atsumiense]|uniref:Protein-L-isoaspartate O-methyltransferase n=1 Tax=Rhodovastum atsumiense TaxID=504468 RepID=A0A5M6IVB2_9PROT|nr:rRNA adenine N-6-methyltransferase family protein [Rhodovastum atsumiense]KAA5612250.1 protein-L-isoaspartate O-methyltransferase [Rhodovastum atsumiense]CAH2601572.1 L-isoaspartyl protein carboxyl methyltransferase [Rhodovastum atsumiense]